MFITNVKSVLLICAATSRWLRTSACSITPQTQRVPKRNHLRFLSRDAPVTVEKKGQISISDCDFDDDSQQIFVQFFDDEDPIQFFVKKGIDSDEYWYGEGYHSHENTLNILITPRTAEHGGYSITGSASISGIVYRFSTLQDMSIQVIEVGGFTDVEESFQEDSLGLRSRHLSKDRQIIETSTTAEITIDVMCLYTPQVVCLTATNGKTENCDTSDPNNYGLLDELCRLSVLETNTAFSTSGARPSLNLVHSQLISPDYVEEEGGQMCRPLGLFKTSNEPAYAAARQLRDEHGADLVSMIVSRGTYCGCGDEYSGYDTEAFSVVHESCASGYFSFAHEIGHNLGADHNRNNDTMDALGHAYGFRDPSNRFRTIMSYNCVGKHCPRVQRFSTNDPNLHYNTSRIGDDLHDNVQQINRVSSNVSKYRNSTRNDADGKSANSTSTNVEGPPAYPQEENICEGNNVKLTIDIETNGLDHQIEWKLINRKGITSHASSDYDNSQHVNTCIWSGNCFTFTITNTNGVGFYNYAVSADGKLKANGNTSDRIQSRVFSIDRKKKFKVGLTKDLKPQKKGCSWVRKNHERKEKLCRSNVNAKSKCPETCGVMLCSL